jgi:UMF1 family MFS transporter
MPSYQVAAQSPAKDDPKTIFGWCMYDWANSAYITTAVGLLPIFFASTVVGEHGAVIFGKNFRADTLWGFVVGLAGVLSFLFAPVLGAIADFSASKKKFLTAFAYTGCLFCTLIYFCHSGDVIKTLFFFLISQVGFVNGNVFYDAFLPHIASEEKMDDVSGKGYAYGYVGGGLQFAIALGLVTLHDKFGLTKEHAARIGIAMSGVWWAVFTLYCLKFVHEPPVNVELPEDQRGRPQWLAYLSLGISRTWHTAIRAAQFRHLVIFLLAFMMYNEGIQTVINMATIYGTNELHLPASALMLTLLIIQFVAIWGSLGFSKIADRFGTKRTIIFGLLIWAGVVIYAYFINTVREFFTLGMIVGLAMGGTQALSRSYYGSMIPQESSAEFFGFYTVFSKFSAIWGPWAFAVITHFSKSARLAILSLITFFVLGLILLVMVDETKAREAR